MTSLQDSLSKFKKQQEKCQSTLINTAARAGSSKSMPSSTSTLANAKSPATPVKFSNDTERLQHINSIRKAPAGAQIKRVIDLLFEVLHPFLISCILVWRDGLCNSVFLFSFVVFLTMNMMILGMLWSCIVS